jgi:hypothetical protein
VKAREAKRTKRTKEAKPEFVLLFLLPKRSALFAFFASLLLLKNESPI